VKDVGRADLELHLAVHGEDEVVGAYAAAVRVLVIEVPGELLARHPHLERVALELLDVAQHDPRVAGEDRDDEGRHGDPDELEPRVAVDWHAVARVARARAELPDAVDRHRHHEHEDRHRDDQQDVVEEVDLARGRGALRREPVQREHEDDAEDGRHGPHEQHAPEGTGTLSRRLRHLHRARC
jgi:hypothetical protein